jgi:hypothetical protein
MKACKYCCSDQIIKKNNRNWLTAHNNVPHVMLRISSSKEVSFDRMNRNGKGLLTLKNNRHPCCWFSTNNMVVVWSTHVRICSSRAVSSSKDVSTPATTLCLKTKLSRHKRLMYATARHCCLFSQHKKDVRTFALMLLLESTLVAAWSAHVLNHPCHHVLWTFFKNFKGCKYVAMSG